MPKAPGFIGPSNLAAYTIPYEAPATNITAPTSDGVYGNWSQMVASLPTNFILCGAVSLNFGSITRPVAVQIGTGGAGSEVVLDSYRLEAWVTGVVDDIVSFITYSSVALGPHFIPAGTRIAARQAQQVASGFNTTPTILYGYSVATPDIFAKVVDFRRLINGLETNGGNIFPDVGYTTLTHAGSAWGNGAWVELDSAVDYDAVIDHCNLKMITTGRTYAVEFGYGSAGNEVALPGYFPMPSLGVLAPSIINIPSPMPLYVPAGQRLVARQKANSVSGQISVAAHLTYLK